MKRRLPITVLLGLAAALVAIAFWVGAQLTGWWVFAIVCVLAKIYLLCFALPFCLPGLSARFRAKPRTALSFAIAAIVATTVTAAAFLPWRDDFCRHFNTNDNCKWYYSGMPVDRCGSDFNDWQRGWRTGRPHLIEFGILVGFYSLIVSGCYLLRLRHFGAYMLTGVACILLAVVSYVADLIILDYDMFLRGIAFDSIAMDLFPYLLAVGGHSIFLFVFLLIFFGAAASLNYRDLPTPVPPARSLRFIDAPFWVGLEEELHHSSPVE